MITNADVLYIAHLSRIHLDPDESQKFTHNLEDILGYIQKLNTLNVDPVIPTTHVLSLENVFRPDIPQPSLSQGDVMHFAVESDGHGSFKVPQVIE